MFPRLSTVFASRWNALWFAAMAILLAYCTVPGDRSAESGDTQSAAADARSAIAASDLPAEDRARAEDTLKAIEAMGKD